MNLSDFKTVSPDNPIICWFSGGITSAVACKIILDLFGENKCRIVFMDTRNEDDDTYRFLKDCEQWYGMKIESITREKYDNIQQVWRKFKGLNFAHGAICSSELKRELRIEWQSENDFSFQVFGFDISEVKRARSFTINYSNTNPIYPLLLLGYSKEMCIEIVQNVGIDVPIAYHMGFNNNNCLKTGCVQGGIGYWQKMKRDLPDRFNEMAEIEHELTELKGKPVTMLKDQSNAAKESGNQLLFLKPHSDYPDIKDISMMKGREPKPLMDCNGFCGVEDLERSPTEKEINFQSEIDFTP